MTDLKALQITIINLKRIIKEVNNKTETTMIIIIKNPYTRSTVSFKSKTRLFWAFLKPS